MRFKWSKDSDSCTEKGLCRLLLPDDAPIESWDESQRDEKRPLLAFNDCVRLPENVAVSVPKIPMLVLLNQFPSTSG